MKQALTLSIVIPAYNEEIHLKACLDSIALQSVLPDEVIVVDNNSVDQTVKIAKKYAFVTVLHEKQQGLIPARNRGFDEARGEILGRINADTALCIDWVKLVKKAFQEDDIAGLTGPANTFLFPGVPWPHTAIWSYGYLYGVEAFFRVRIMWGANMAIRKSVWQQIAKETHPEDAYVHEDQDLSVLVAGVGGKIKLYSSIRVSTDEQSYFHWPKLKEYWVRRWRTKRYHKERGTFTTPTVNRISYAGVLLRSVSMPGNTGFILASFIYFYVGLFAKKIRLLLTHRT